MGITCIVNRTILVFCLTISLREILGLKLHRSVMRMTSTGPVHKVVILGAGIHGASVAYHLSTKFGILPTVVERVSIAAAASGKAGGFLAREWGSGTTQQLHQVSFDMHEVLAKELNVESYRHVATLSVDGNKMGKSPASWLDRKSSSSILDSGTNTAQVTPLELTTKLMDAAISKGVTLVHGTVEGIDIVDGKVTGVRITGQDTLPADRVVMCMGPWSGVMAEDWFGMTLPMEGVKSTSIVYKDLESVRSEPYALFCAEDNNGCHLEMYPRPNGEAYLCGCGGSDYVNGDRLRAGGDCESADMVIADPKRVKAASDSFRSMTSLGDKEPDLVQACMRPCPSDGLPVMGVVPRVEGAYISCGHNCWGILWAPASGLAMAELVATGVSTTLDLKSFAPDRFDRSGRNTRRGKKMGTVEVGEQW